MPDTDVDRAKPEILLVGASTRAAAHGLARCMGLKGLGTAKRPTRLPSNASTRASDASMRASGASPSISFQPLGICAIDQFADQDLVEVGEQVVQVPDLTRPQIAQALDRLRSLGKDPKIWIPTGGMENQPDSWSYLQEAIASELPSLGGTEAMNELRRIENWKVWGEASGVPLPETMAQLPAGSVGSSPASRWLRKSRLSSGGLGVSGFDAQDFEPADGEPRQWRKSDWYWQRKVEGMDHSALAVCWQGTSHWIGATRQLSGTRELGAPPFLYSGSIGPVELGSFRAPVEKLLGLAAQQTQWTGLLGVDFRIDDDRLWLLELNPRYTAGSEVLERSSGKSVVSYLLDLPHGIPSQWPSSEEVWAKGVWYVGRGFRGQVRHGSWDRVRGSGEIGCRPIADVAGEGSVVEGPAPAFTVFAHSTDSPFSLETLRQLGATWETLIFDLI